MWTTYLLPDDSQKVPGRIDWVISQKSVLLFCICAEQISNKGSKVKNGAAKADISKIILLK